MPKCTFCKKSAYFNIFGNKAQYCGDHKTPEMVNVVDKLCETPECISRALFHFPGNTAGKSCSNHKEEGMVNLKSKRCAEPGCYVSPIYHFAGENKGKYCIEHKHDGMVNVTGKRCEKEGCNINAQFNLPGKKKGKYCSQHKEEGMVDVKHKRCEFGGCNKLPSFKFETDTQPRFCFDHKWEGMINGKRRICKFKGCKKTPSYNYEGLLLHLYCVEHKLEGMVDVKHHSCLSEWCLTRPNVKYEGYCLFCYINLFPDKTVAHNYKTKEKTIVDCIMTYFPNYSWVLDKKIQDGCSKRRPDLLLDLGDQIIIIEIDENQHNEYDCMCENKRLMEISKDLGHRPIVFIRFNPDQYKKSDGTKIKSCWSKNHHGILYLVKTRTDEWTDRMNSLTNQIEYWVKHRTEKMVEVVNLYFDE